MGLSASASRDGITDYVRYIWLIECILSSRYVEILVFVCGYITMCILDILQCVFCVTQTKIYHLLQRVNSKPEIKITI